jgi:tape measure domain-containing protein
MNHLLRYTIDLRDGNFSRGMAQAQAQTRTLDQMVQRVGATIAGAFAVGGLSSFGRQAVQTSADMEGLTNSIRFASKSEEEGARNLQYLDNLTAKHGSNLLSATRGYKTFLGSMQDVPYTMNEIRRMYQQVDVANRVMNLSAEDSQGVYLALGQIMSKGKVQAEELRGQIGERIPGAFAIAARAMGVTQEQLNKMMDNGQLMAVDFLPRFAAELERTFGSGLEKATNSFQSQSNRRENAILQETTTIGTKLQPAYLTLQDMQLKALQVGSGLLEFYANHNQAINTGVAILATAGAAYSIAALRLKVLTFSISGNTVATYANVLGKRAMLAAEISATLGAGGLRVAIDAVTASMLANPITWFVGGLALLAIGTKAWTASNKDATLQQKKLSDTMRDTQAEMNADLNVLKKINPANAQRAGLIDEINKKYGQYLPQALSEKSTLEDIAKAQNAANEAMKEKIYLQAKNEALSPILKDMAQSQALIYKAEVEMEKLKQKMNSGQSDGAEGFAIDRLKQSIALNKSIVSSLGSTFEGESQIWDKGLAKMGIKPGKEFNANFNNNKSESITANRSVRNVNVTIEKLVEKMEVIFNPSKSSSNVSDVKKEMTNMLLAVLRDAETAL